MFLLLAALLLFYAAFLEVQFQADLRHADTTQGRIVIRIAGFHKTWRLILLRTPQGHRLLLADSNGVQPLNPDRLAQGRSRLMLALFRRADRARKFLLRRIQLDRLDALVLLRTADAARSAVLSGTLQGILACIPATHRKGLRIRMLPEFFRAHSTVNARCIIRIRLGTIILTAMMLLMAYFREQRLAESEAM